MMNEEQYAQMRADLAANDKEHQSFKRRLDEHDEALKKQTEILVLMERQSNAIEKMTNAIGKVEDKLNTIDGRLSIIEKEPADKWKKTTYEIIKYIVIAAIGFGLSLLVKTGV